MTTKDAARYLGIKNDNTIRKYIHKGYLKAKKIGDVWWISKKSLQERRERLEKNR